MGAPPLPLLRARVIGIPTIFIYFMTSAMTHSASRWVYRLAAIACSTLVLAACGKHETDVVRQKQVSVVKVSASSGPGQWQVPGQVGAREETTLSFRTDGKIIERAVRVGDQVAKDQVLAQLDPVPARQGHDSAQAQLAAARKGLEFATSQRKRDQQQARAQLISRAQLEQSENAYAQAKAALTQAEQQAAQASDRLSYTKLKAMHAGVITAEHAQTGQNVAPGQPVYSLAWSEGKDVIGDIPERLLASVSVGQQASVRLNALPDQVFPATVREIAPAADPVSRTFRVKLTLDPGAVQARLGMTASIVFTYPDDEGAPPRFSLPATALFHDGDVPAVWLVQQPDSTLVLRQVTVISQGANTVEVSGDLKPGDMVVAQGVHTVSKGMKVVASQEQAP